LIAESRDAGLINGILLFGEFIPDTPFFLPKPFTSQVLLNE
jgi:hypothetical protein